MNFLNPAILFGLLASAIPLILHFLNLRKLKKIEFSSLKFIKELQKTQIRRLKIKQILLLILRILLICFIVLAFARPTVESNLPLIGTYSKSSVVIIIDNSFSMDVSDELGNRLNQAKQVANNVINSLIDGDDIAIIELANPDKINISLSKDIALIKEEIRNIKISNQTHSLHNSLTKAYKLLDNSDNLNKEIYIISDAQDNLYLNPTDDTVKLQSNNTSIFFIPIGKKSNTIVSNISIDSVEFITQIFQTDSPVEFNVHLRNHTNKPINDLLLSMFLNDARVTQKTIDLEPEAKKIVQMQTVVSGRGLTKCYFEIEEDGLEQDNRRYFGFIMPDKPKIALVGSPEETAILSTILRLNQSLANLSIFSQDDFVNVDLNNYELIYFASYPLRADFFDRLDNFIRTGGAALLFPNSKATAEEQSQYFSKIGITLEKQIGKFTNPIEFSSYDNRHTIFRGVFKTPDETRNKLESAKIYSMLPSLSGQALISTPYGHFLSEHQNEFGKIFYIAVALDNTWSDIALRGIFPVIVYRSAIYLTAKENIGMNNYTGNDLRITLPAKYANSSLNLIEPELISYPISAVNLPSSSIIEISNPNQVGIYTIVDDRNYPIKMIANNINPSESMINSPEKNKLKEKMLTFVSNETKIKEINASDFHSKYVRARTGSELWQLFVFLALIAAITEMFVAKNKKNDIEN